MSRAFFDRDKDGRANGSPIPRRPKRGSTVALGSRVTIERNDGRRQTFRIVGLDEADPEKGTLSKASPLAKALMGKGVGAVVHAGQGEAEIVAID